MLTLAEKRMQLQTKAQLKQGPDCTHNAVDIEIRGIITSGVECVRVCVYRLDAEVFTRRELCVCRDCGMRALCPHTDAHASCVYRGESSLR